MKSKKHRNRNIPNPAVRAYPSGYEPAFKKSVILYAEQKSNSEARKRFGISEETIRRWRKIKREIFELAQACVRRSQRHAYVPQASGSQGPTSEPPAAKKEKDKGEEDERKSKPNTDLDSMPLQQRLSQNHNEQPPSTPTQEPVLQSQPISPTKLKVTRQGAKPHQPPAKAASPPPQNPEVCLRWNSHHTNMQSTFPSLLTKEQYVDATLVSEGKTLKCHRMILSSCSPYFEQVLEGIGPFQHPVLFMKDIPFWILKALCDFMYAGEVHIYQEKLQELLNVAEALKIKGLAGNADTKEEIKPVLQEIKQEIDATPLPEKPLKEENEEDLSLPPKLARHDGVRPSKKKEEKKSKHAGQVLKEKEKDKVGEELLLKVTQKINPKVVLPKMTPKVVLSKVPIPKAQSTPKTTVKNVMKNVLQKVPKTSTSKAAHASRKSDTSRRSDKHKADVIAQKEKEKEKDKSPLKKDNINDPLDLLQPVYEEIAKEDPPPMLKCINPAKLKDRGNMPVRKGVNKKVKKRRYAEYAEEREESPPPVFPSRKGTRSRPHVKIPKFFHTHYEETQKETTDATIVREPHTDQSDPLIGLEEVEEIKAEPLDVEENTIEMEENYMQDQEMPFQEGEEIIGNYDSPIVNIKREGMKRNTPNIFKKMLDPQPVIMNIHTVTEEHHEEVGLLLRENTLKIVDISQISTGQNRIEETIVGTNSFDTMINTQEKTSEIMISNVQSMAEIGEDHRLKESEIPKESEVIAGETEERSQRNESSILTEDNSTRTVLYPHPIDPSLRVNEEPHNTLLNTSESEEILMETNQIPFRIKVENVQCESSQDCDEFRHTQVENETDLDRNEASYLSVPEQESAEASASLGSLEIRLDTCDIGSQHRESEEIAVQENEGVKDSLAEDCMDTVNENQNEIGQDVEEKHKSTADEALAVNAEPLQKVMLRTQSAMSVDSEIEGGSLELSTCEPNYGIVENCSSEKIPKTAEDSDVGTVRGTFVGTETIAGLDGVVTDTTHAKLEEMHRGKDQDKSFETAVEEGLSGQSTANYSPKDAQQFIDENKEANVDSGIEGSSREAISYGDEPVQRDAVNSEEMMSVGTVSQEVMSIGIGSQELEESIQSTAEDIPKSGYNEVVASETFSQDPLQNLGEVETVENVGEANLVVRDRRELYQDDLQETDSHNLQINPEDQSTCEEDALNRGGCRDSIQNTPEIMSLGSENQTTEQDILCEVDLPLQESTEENSRTEPVLVRYVNNGCEGLKNREELEKRVFDEAEYNAAPLESTDFVDGNTKDPVLTGESDENIKEIPENIEVELEQCLATTSDIAPLPSEEKLKLGTDTLSFDDDEDFTKDIEFDTFIGRNRPTNYLGDEFNEDFEMEDAEQPKSGDKVAEGKDRLLESEDRNLGGGDSETVGDIKGERTGGEDKNTVGDAISDRGVAIENRLAKSDNKNSREVMGDNIGRTEDEESREENIKQNLQTGDLTHGKMKSLDDENILEEGHKVNLNKNVIATNDDQLDVHQNISEPTENYKHHQGSIEDDERLEESLLADADDDVEMSEASTSKKADDEDGAEKTLEMIVNDLNESLGELRK